MWYGPDSYMGANIVELFRQMADMTDDEISRIHPEHNRNSIISLLSRLRYYQVCQEIQSLLSSINTSYRVWLSASSR